MPALGTAESRINPASQNGNVQSTNVITSCMLVYAASHWGSCFRATTVALFGIAGLKSTSMSLHSREPHFKQSFLFVNDPVVPFGIQRLHGYRLLLMCCNASDLCLAWLPAESSVGNGWF